MTREARDRYRKAMHAMQTGVSYQMENPDNKETQPKHLRVGVNSTMVDTGALAKLLIEKGVFTQDEFEEMLATIAEAEAASYQERVREQFHNPNIFLG